MKKHIQKAAAVLVLALATLSLGACSSTATTGTHEMGPPNRSTSMGDSVMKERAN